MLRQIYNLVVLNIYFLFYQQILVAFYQSIVYSTTYQRIIIFSIIPDSGVQS